MLTTLRSLLCPSRPQADYVFKDGVRYEDMHPEVVARKGDIISVFNNRGYLCVVTSARDGEHMEDSLHYEGRALDLRHRQMPEERKTLICDELRDTLGNDWDVVCEDTHIHIEYDPN